MNKFLTLIKRDLADYKGALIITPLVISAVILLLVISSVFMGSLRVDGNNFILFGGSSADVNADVNIEDNNGNNLHLKKDAGGHLVYVDEQGQTKPVMGDLTPDKIKKLSAMIAFGNLIGSLLPLFIASIVVLFVLSGSLYEERKDKSIMFWKSLPISDIETVGAKTVSVVGIGLGFALLVTFVLHIILIIITTLASNQIGLNMISIPDVLEAVGKLWIMVALMLVAYVLWAFPVYSWILAASSYAPKAPFLLAFVPIVLLPLLAKIFLKGASDLFFAPLQHLTGYPIWKALDEGKNAIKDGVGNNADFLVALDPIMKTFSEPSLWIGLVVGVGLLYAASEIRRRRSF